MAVKNDRVTNDRVASTMVKIRQTCRESFDVAPCDDAVKKQGHYTVDATAVTDKPLL